MPVYLLGEDVLFPSPLLAREDGLIAIGGDLSLPRLLLAYRSGIFPWYNEGEPVLWWSPDPRFVLFPEELHISRRLARTLRQNRYSITFNQCFERVIRNCSEVRRRRGDGTWITEEMIDAYCRLHREGHALSCEVWMDSHLAGGLYGVLTGKVFSGESMFSVERDASKVGFVHTVTRLVDTGICLIDCQVETPYMRSFGARGIPRTRFMEFLQK